MLNRKGVMNAELRNMSSAPAKNRPPPFFESDEVVTLLAYMALGPQVPADPKEKSAARAGREKAAVWLGKNKPTDTTQAAALRLLVKLRARRIGLQVSPRLSTYLNSLNACVRAEIDTKMRSCRSSLALRTRSESVGTSPDSNRRMIRRKPSLSNFAKNSDSIRDCVRTS